jgi:hypothetical protein
MDTLYDEIMKKKKGTISKMLHMGRKMVGL